jgi:hypothetical protein
MKQTQTQTKPEKANNDIAAPSKLNKAYSLAAVSVYLVSSYGGILFSHLFGMKFEEATKKVLIENAPLTIAASIISVRIYSIRDKEINYYFEFILYSLILWVAGYGTQLITGHEIFRNAYENTQQLNISNWQWLSKIASMTLLIIGGYIDLYGIKETLMTIITGIAMPWVMLRKYNEYSSKISEI